ncbi:MarR family winged helix-turn-helix transcriptional regulator [Neisseria perflava]|uniref:MarR family winged helix-turn-helix transcriptional regulator n=1 Tax=Neisseria perflava TaxID=33053 RepID=UPI00209E178F|nr:MarR family transcriptional regulator [Neisseria perflava]MCP1659242.1 DNA-binding MarR family transcriptional regulator [Neisseria perflava]MCP1771716.1 DNA-binding MarR family transcriptional regulator [Neisseria perflava]
MNTPAAFPPLNDFMCFAAYTANLAFGKAYKPYLGKLGLTYTQWITLIALGEAENQTVKQLGEKLFLASNTLTPLLKGLEKQGLVVRARSQQDERQVVVNLTAAGREKLAESHACLDIFQSYGLSVEETVALQKAVSKLRDNLLAGLQAHEQAE